MSTKILRLTLINAAHVVTHLLFAAIAIMAWAILTNRQLDWTLLAVALIGGLLPDVDTSTSFIGRALLPLARFLEDRFGHRQEVHTLWPPLALWAAAALWPSAAWAVYALAAAIGFASHLLLDTLNPEGVAFLLPLANFRATLLGGRVKRQQASETVLLVVLIVGLLAVSVFTRFEPGEFIQRLLPTIDTAREQYRAWEGLYAVYADLEGIWNVNHQRYAGRCLVLGFDPGGAFKLQDIHTGQQFTAGRHPVDDLYASRIVLVKGERTLPVAPDSPTAVPIPTPTPTLMTILIEGVHDPLLEIVIRPGDTISRGQLIAELFPASDASLSTSYALLPTSPVTDALRALSVALAKAEMETAQAEYRRALEGQAPSEAAILQAESAIAQIEAAIASLQYLQAANPALSYVPAQISAAEARLAAAEARLEEVKKWQSPSGGDIAVAKANLAEAELRYQIAVLPPTPMPLPTVEATPAPHRVYSMVNGLVWDIHVSRVVGNVATVEVLVELGR